jgi:hypothetical protein
MTDLEGFGARLKSLLQNKDKHSHPFMCDGSPIGRKVFVVGHNPATRLSEPFSSYWSDEVGCNKLKFLEDYKRQRNRLKGVRRRIEQIAALIGQENILDTNIYTQVSTTEALLKDRHKTTDVFEFLLSELRPRVLLAHGKPSKSFFEKRCNLGSDRNTALWDNIEFKLVRSRHLSRISNVEFDRIGEALKAHVMSVRNDR